ncbi:hypothetical protein Trydic_g20521 [Trypoxylus dichotomus]
MRVSPARVRILTISVSEHGNEPRPIRPGNRLPFDWWDGMVYRVLRLGGGESLGVVLVVVVVVVKDKRAPYLGFLRETGGQ